ncbi:FG-GAP-like repeat-containing protein [Svornostia abyssi]|uniref:FG-GAP-like repeat-containing protein n=1 Tax=Svornostia abyssi TaxID=2898438 RepID=A0ABY5PIT4_9ACTN|nr:FG-GAP-like repeat-containing protein [Parviterribacteraceae bacterium J379]
MRTRLIPALAAGALALAGTATAHAAPLPLSGTFGITHPAAEPDDLVLPGFAGSLGDLNGDGADEYTMFPKYSPDGGLPTVAVVFGSRARRNVSLDGTDPRVRTYDGVLLAPAGDVNGDGTDDVIVSTFLTDVSVPPTVTVVFGGPGIADVRLDQPGARGFRIFNAQQAARAGDMNGDGRGDLFVTDSADDGDVTGGAVLFGKVNTLPMNAAEPGPGKVRLSSSVIAPVNDASPVAAGDVNGDGLSDIAFKSQDDRLAVVFGSRWLRPADIDALGPRGFSIEGTWGGVHAETLDFTGDRRADLIVSNGGSNLAVVPGKTTSSPVSPWSAGSPAIIVPSNGTGRADDSVAVVDDLNGDGRADLLTTAELGLVRVAPGQRTPGAVTLGQTVGGAFTQTLKSAGDVDGDGRKDAIAWELVLPGVGGPTEGFRATQTLITAGRDILAPRVRSAFLSNPAFRVGQTTEVQALVSEAAQIDLVIRRANGTVAGAVRVPTSTQLIQFTWDGRINGRALAPGDYVTTATPVDLAGNRGEGTTMAFTILP